MKRQELMVLLMIAEGRGDDLFQIYDRDLLRQWVLSLAEKGMVVSTQGIDPILVPMRLTDKGQIFLSALDTVPLPSPAWSMNQIAGE